MTHHPSWRAGCDACGWAMTLTTYAAAGAAARYHDCPDASTTVTDVGERIDLTDQVRAICADLEADLGAAAYRMAR